MARLMASSAATTTSTLYPVRNLMSSMAKMFEGSAVARIRVEPARLTGITVCLSATSSGMSLITAPSISNSSRLTDGTPYCLATKSVSSDSWRNPSCVIWAPRRAPLVRASSLAFRSCSVVRRFSLTRSSPIRSFTRCSLRQRHESPGCAAAAICREAGGRFTLPCGCGVCASSCARRKAVRTRWVIGGARADLYPEARLASAAEGVRAFGVGLARLRNCLLQHVQGGVARAQDEEADEGDTHPEGEVHHGAEGD